MALYTVHVRRVVEHFATIEVEAANADLAIETVEKDARLLQEDINNGVFWKTDWELEDYNIEIEGDVYTEDK